MEWFFVKLLKISGSYKSTNDSDLRCTWDHFVGVHRHKRHVLTYCNMLQCVAVCCSVLQCVAVCCSVRTNDTYLREYELRKKTALQHTTTHFNPMENTATYCNMPTPEYCDKLQHTARHTYQNTIQMRRKTMSVHALFGVNPNVSPCNIRMVHMKWVQFYHTFTRECECLVATKTGVCVCVCVCVCVSVFLATTPFMCCCHKVFVARQVTFVYI